MIYTITSTLCLEVPHFENSCLRNFFSDFLAAAVLHGKIEFSGLINDKYNK